MITILSALSTILTFLQLFIPIRLPLPNWSRLGWLVAFLVMTIVLLLLLIEAVFRFHSKTINDLNAAHREEIIEWRENDYVSYKLGLGYGMVLLARNLIHYYGGPLHKEGLQHLNGIIDSTLFDCFGASVRDEYYESTIEVPDSPDEQRWWIDNHYSKLEAIIKGHQQKQSIARKAKS